MTDLIVTHAALAMSSKEIAELTQKRHADVLRDIRSLLSQVHDLKDNADLRYEEIQGVSVIEDVHTKRVSEIQLDKDHTLTLLTGYDAKARMKVVRRWQELESTTQRDLTTGDALIAMALAYKAHETRIMALEAKQAETKQAIAELVGGDDYATAKGYARTNGLPAGRDFLNKVGRRAATMCRERGTRVGRVADEVWGEVNSYPRSILAAAFAESVA